MPLPTEKHSSELCFFERLHHSKEWTISNSKSGTSLTEMMHMNELCPFSLELNERLKIDVTVERMCLNKDLAQRILEYESKQKEMCSAMFLTSRI